MILDQEDSFDARGYPINESRLDQSISTSVNSNFLETLKGIKDLYRNNEVFNQKRNKLVIRDSDFNLLSKFERNTIKTIANIYSITKDPNAELSFDTFKSVIEKLSQGKTDMEKHYLVSLFFPERVKNIHHIYPFPVPTYTYVQKFQMFVVPNANGCFITQVVCPMLLDATPVSAPANVYASGNIGTAVPPIWNGNCIGLQNGTAAAATGSTSNVYVNNHAALDGTTLGLASHFTPINQSQSIPNAFNTYVLQSCKISARYVGRGDVQSGYFGASYHLSAASSKGPDPATTQFAFCDDSINAVISDVTEGVNAVYYPPDYSYLNFLRVNQDNVLGGQMSTSLRLNIYGASLPPPILAGNSAGVILSFITVWNVIPTPLFAELLPLDYNIEEESVDLLETAKFLPQSGLTTYKNSEIGEVERMLELPSYVRKNALEDLRASKNDMVGSRRRTVLDMLKPLTGAQIPPEISIEKKLFTRLVEESNSRKDGINMLNKANDSYK